MKIWEVVIEYNNGNIFKYESNQMNVNVAIAVATKEMINLRPWDNYPIIKDVLVNRLEDGKEES